MKWRFLVFFFAAASLSPAEAALPPLGSEELGEFAEVILTGKVVDSRVLLHRKPGASIYLVRLGCRIDAVEKGGELLTSPKSIEIRCWRMRRTKMVGPSGHLEIPAENSNFRMWLRKREEGFWEPLEPNGIELLDGSTPMVFAEFERSYSLKQYLVWGGIGLALLLATAVLRFGGFWSRSRAEERIPDLGSNQDETDSDENNDPSNQVHVSKDRPDGVGSPVEEE
ncbi:MAG: hypothetical protein AAGC68_01890 [Verrucomicrobiota bacterium]